MDSELRKLLIDNELQAALVWVDSDPFVVEERYIDALAEAARKYANPLDGLWWCEQHGYRIDRFEGVTPEHCLYEGRPGDCKPIAALIVRGIEGGS